MMKIWTVTFNDDSGSPSSAVFNNLPEAEDAEREWLLSYQGAYPEIDFEASNSEIFDALTEQLGFIDSITIEEHNIHPPETTGLDAIIADVVHTNDELEVDSNAVISMGEDPGAYVSCWKWVRFHEVPQPMAIIEDNGTVWYFDCFEEFMTVWHEEPNCNWVKGTDELLEKSDGPNDSWEYLTREERRYGNV